MNFTILTGMSGSGKSKTIQIFEDLGYFCVDNMPPSLIPMLANMLDALTGKFSNIALVVDVRVGDMINELLGQIEELRKMYDVRLIFLDAEDDTLVNRYKETRRSHPLNDPDGLLASIEKERRMLSKLKDNADYVIDTTTFKGTDLRNHLLGIYNMKKAAAFEVKVVSFGFKNGIPIDADMMFDVRCFPNPFYIPELKHKTGKEKEVQDYVMNNPEAKGYFDRIVDMIEYIIPVFRGEGRNSLIIAVGCTGGHHRSVTFVEKLTTLLSNKGLSVKAVHRDIDI
ncbi:MAG: RNase adapter RapZ [Clostridia bacterium]|nr:RNase adapter RapZ [Clostridia bacterium]